MKREDQDAVNSLEKRNYRRTISYRRGESMTTTLINSYQPTIISDKRRKLEDLCRDLVVNNDHIHVVEQRMRVAIEQGLSKEGNKSSTVKCFPTYVRYLPRGDEVGKFLALDLGGTNFRVLVVDIEPDQKFQMDSEVYSLSQELMEGPGALLFDYIAKCLADFVTERNLRDESRKLPLGFTFRWRSLSSCCKLTVKTFPASLVSRRVWRWAG